MPKISIIVPVYNVEKFLPRCLDSILAQTFRDWECLVIDDGSTDSSGAICDEYASRDHRFKVFHKENGGVSSARNLGLDNASGEWVAFCDSDDAVDSEWLDSMLRTGIEDKAQLVVCDFYEFTQNERIRRFAWDISGTHPYDSTLTYPQNVNHAIMYSWGIVWNLLIDRMFLKTCKLRFDEGITYSEDSVYFIKLLAFGIKVSYLDRPLYFYNRTNEFSVTQRLSSKNIADRICAFKLLSRTFHDLNLMKETRLAMSDRFTSLCIGIASDNGYHDLIISAMCPYYNSRIFSFKGGNIKAKILLWLITHSMRSIADIIILIYKKL